MTLGFRWRRLSSHLVACDLFPCNFRLLVTSISRSSPQNYKKFELAKQLNSKQFGPSTSSHKISNHCTALMSSSFLASKNEAKGNDAPNNNNNSSDVTTSSSRRSGSSRRPKKDKKAQTAPIFLRSKSFYSTFGWEAVPFWSFSLSHHDMPSPNTNNV
jgi:hypothetical protein